MASNCGMVFLKFTDSDVSHEIKTTKTLCILLDRVIQDGGVENAIKNIIGNAAAYVIHVCKCYMIMSIDVVIH